MGCGSSSKEKQKVFVSMETTATLMAAATISGILSGMDKLNQYETDPDHPYMDKAAQLWVKFAQSIAKAVPATPLQLGSANVTVCLPKDPNRTCITALGVRFFHDGDEGVNVTGTLMNTLEDDVLHAMGDLDVTDPLFFWPTPEEGVADAKKTFGDSLPAYHVEWNDWQSDMTLTEFVFYGAAQYYVKAANHVRKDFTVPSEAAYEVDLSLCANYTNRPVYEQYGVIAYFTKELKPCGMYWCSAKRLIKSDDGMYQHVSALFRSTMAMLFTVYDHLIVTHWIVSNGLLLASERYLDADHPIRRLIKPHTFGAASVNSASTCMLAPVGNLAYRVFGLDAKSFPVAFDDLIQSWKYETYEEHFKASGLPQEMHDQMPLYQDGLDLWNIHEKYIGDYVNIYYPTDESVTSDPQIKQYWADFQTQLPNRDYGLPPLSKVALIKQLTHSIFWVTGNHTFVGDVQEYLVSPDGCPAALPKEPKWGVCATKQQGTLALALICLTSPPKPLLLNDWSHLAVAPVDKVKVVQAEWQRQLQQLVVTIDERNKSRPKPFDKMNPRIMNAGVSV